jgi:integrase/recombinase XerD
LTTLSDNAYTEGTSIEEIRKVPVATVHHNVAMTADDSLIMGFLLHLRASGKSPKTETTYRESINIFLRFKRDMGMPDFVSIRPEHLQHFLSHLHDRGNSPATISVRYRALHSFYKWLSGNAGEILAKDNPFLRLTPYKVPNKIQPHYTPDDVNRVLGRCDDSLLGSRDAALVTTLFDTGLRATELASLTRADLDFKNMTLRVRNGKGGKDRVVGIGYKTAQSLERYVRKTSGKLWASDEDRPLFANREGKPLTYNAIMLLLRRIFVRAGVPYYGAHGFRRGFAISYLDSGGSPEDLKVLAGWDSDAMLRRYTRATERERALKGHRKHSPADRLR